MVEGPLPVVLEPIHGNDEPRLSGGQRAAADLDMERVLGRVLGPDHVRRERAEVRERVSRSAPSLWPQVARIAGMTAQLQGDEVILLVVSRGLVRRVGRRELLR